MLHCKCGDSIVGIKTNINFLEKRKINFRVPMVHNRVRPFFVSSRKMREKRADPTKSSLRKLKEPNIRSGRGLNLQVVYTAINMAKKKKKKKKK